MCWGLFVTCFIVVRISNPRQNILFAWSRTCEPRLAYLNLKRCYSRDGYGNIQSGTRRSQGNCSRSFGHSQNSIKLPFDCDLVYELAGLNTVRSSRYILCCCESASVCRRNNGNKSQHDVRARYDESIVLGVELCWACSMLSVACVVILV